MMEPRKPLHFSETPEFKEAVAKASAEAAAAAKAEMHAEIAPLLDALKQSQGAPAVDNDQMSMFRQMAMAIAEISDQDQGRQRVPPAELATRARGRADMEAAMLKHQRIAEEYKATTGDELPSADAPTYLMIGKAYLGDELHNPFKVDEVTKKPYPVSVVWMGPPSDAMRPLNDAAKEIFGYFKISIGELMSKEAKDAPVTPTQGWVSAGGAVILGMNGAPVSMRDKRALPSIETAYERGPGVFDPRRDRINILGTVAEPARQTGAPDAPRRGV